jgi:hypothetical protein
MKQGNKYPSDKYSEKLIPTRVLITRKRGELSYVFEIDGYRGEKTGEIHYKASEVARIEKFFKSKNPIYSFTVSTIGLILNLETPLAVATESISTGTLFGLNEIFRLQPSQARTHLPQPILCTA